MARAGRGQPAVLLRAPGSCGFLPVPRALWGWARPQNVLVAPCHHAQSSVCPGGPATGLSAPVMDALRQEAAGQAAGEGAAARARLKRAGGCCRLSAGRSREGLISRALNQCQSEQRRWGATSAPLRRGRQPPRSSFCELRRGPPAGSALQRPEDLGCASWDACRWQQGDFWGWVQGAAALCLADSFPQLKPGLCRRRGAPKGGGGAWGDAGDVLWLVGSMGAAAFLLPCIVIASVSTQSARMGFPV